MERWSLIPNHINYAVSTYGRLMNVRNQFILKPFITQNGYCRIALSFGTFSVHRLVALVHIPNPNNYPYVNHKDGDKLNNKFDNLEWCTAKQNDFHARNLKLKGYSGFPNDNRPVIATHIESGERFTFVSTGECSRFLDTNNGSLTRVLKGERKMHKGFYIEYLEKVPSTDMIE